MDIFVYLRGPVECALDELEDAVELAIGQVGEVTGSGIGSTGSNLDIEITDKNIDVAAAVRLVQKALAAFDLPSSSVIVADGTEHPIRT